MAKRDLIPQTTIPQEESKWLTPGIGGIGLASFLADMGHEVPTALFASLVAGVLGVSVAVLGLIEGLADGLAGLARLLGGPLADDMATRRKTALGGYEYCGQHHRRCALECLFANGGFCVSGALVIRCCASACAASATTNAVKKHF